MFRKSCESESSKDSHMYLTFDVGARILNTNMLLVILNVATRKNVEASSDPSVTVVIGNVASDSDYTSLRMRISKYFCDKYITKSV